MTIKELEKCTGMPRANIRFYESRGLIRPARRANGYRDYTQEDAVTLQKIRLLRELHMDIDTIRMVQQEALTLERALFVHLNRLEAERAAVGRAAEVCREMEEAGTAYSALEPGLWLERLAAPSAGLRVPAVPEAGAQSRVQEEPVECARRHPWLRLLARGVDLGLCTLAVRAVLLLAVRWNYDSRSAAAGWLVNVLALGVMLVCEPLLLHFWGWTPGKWIFGLRVRTAGLGRNLTAGEGLYRTARVIFTGCGAGIPLANLWCGWKCWKRYKAEEDAPWDEENDYICESRRLSWLMWLGASALVLALSLIVTLQGMLPPNRGDLTVEEYCENVNFYLDYLNISGERLTPEGEWERGSKRFRFPLLAAVCGAAWSLRWRAVL